MLTDATYIERTQRLGAQMGKQLTPADVWSSRDSALQRLANEVAGDPIRRPYTQVELNNLAYSGGSASLSTSGLLPETVRNLRLLDTGGNPTPVSILPYGSSRHDLSHPRNEMTLWAVVEAGAIYLMGGDGASAPPDGSLSFVYNMVPTLANLPPQLEDDLIKIAVTLAEVSAQEEAA